MIPKHPILPERVRKIPKQFSWLDHRLVRDRYIERMRHPDAALYLFLATVGDAQGLSYYGDASIMKRLSMDIKTLAAARDNLRREGLIAWKKPLYQVLALDPCKATSRSSRPKPLLLGDILKQAMGENA